MKLKDMKVDISYRVTRGSKCKTFRKGDHVKLYENGDVGSRESGGWLAACDFVSDGGIAKVFPTVTIVLARDVYEKRKQRLEEELQAVKEILEE